MFELPNEKWCEDEWCTIKKHAKYGQILIIKDKNIVNVWANTNKGLRRRGYICINEDRADERYKFYVTDKYELSRLVKEMVIYYGQS